MKSVDDRELPHCRGAECPTCGAHDGEGHGLRCADAAEDDTIVPATCGPVSVDGDGREVPT